MVQQLFSKTNIFNGLIVAMLVVGAHLLIADLPDRQPRPDRRAAVRFEAVRLDPRGFAPLRVAGAWRVTSDEPRMGGVSGLAVDRGELLALTDSGVVIRLPKPSGATGVANFSDLPSGPGDTRHKAGRDSEALARDAGGRGWWVAFENRHSAWLFDSRFDRVIRRIDLRAFGWRPNKGAEGAVSTVENLLLFPESGDEIVRLGAGVERLALASQVGRLSDALMLSDGRIVVLSRNFSPAGFSARLMLLEGAQLVPIARLRLGRLDNPEAIAAETLPGGVIRLWVMTDNDFRRRVPTLLVALDWRD